MEGSDPLADTQRPVLREVLESAARLQAVVPDAVLVEGSAAALYGDHRDSYDHDHVLADLAERFEAVLEAVERTDGWVTNRVTPGKVILGELGGIETGIRQLLRRRPLEVTEVRLRTEHRVRVPTLEEILRVKGFLIIRRNQTRDYLETAALTDRAGVDVAGRVLAGIDDYYEDQRGPNAKGVATQLARQLAEPSPRDSMSARELTSYKGIDPRWSAWSAVRDACQAVALEMVKP